MGRKMRNMQRWLRKKRVSKGTTNDAGIPSWLYDPRPPREKKTSRIAGSKKYLRFPQRFVLFAVLILFTAFSAHSFYRFDRRILPLVLEAAEMRIQTEINNVINSVIHEIITENQVLAEDFIIHSQPMPGAQPVISINTVLVNEICNAAAQAISSRLNNMEPEIVSVPIGMMFNLDTLAQVGPHFTFKLAPIGNALVDYETSFTAVGINQTHFSVWLTVESVVRIINPVQSSEIHVTRHVSLVDTIISGTVPGTYLNMDTPVLNLGSQPQIHMP